MPSKVRVVVLEARNLPCMDRNVMGLGEAYTDAYVDMKFKSFDWRTQVRRSLIHFDGNISGTYCWLMGCVLGGTGRQWGGY